MADFEERSKYKSWGYLKKQMSDLLCEKLKGRIAYFFTNYHEVHNSYGRATINYDKKELVAFSWVEMYEQERDVSEKYKEMDHVPSALEDFDGMLKTYRQVHDALLKEKWLPNCTLYEEDFIEAITVYLKTNIKDSLSSENYLLRIFAYMDRRVGKRTLIKIKDEVGVLPEWVRQFYRIRCEAEGLEI